MHISTRYTLCFCIRCAIHTISTLAYCVTCASSTLCLCTFCANDTLCFYRVCVICFVCANSTLCFCIRCVDCSISTLCFLPLSRFSFKLLLLFTDNSTQVLTWNWHSLLLLPVTMR